MSGKVALVIGIIVAVPALAALGAAAAAQQTTPISFSRTVYPIFEAAQCRGCHNEDGVASATRLHFPEETASPDDVEAFGITLAVLVDRADPSRSLLLNKPTNRERHTGGMRIRPGSFEEEALNTWVQHLATVNDETVSRARARLAESHAPSKAEPLLRRLTHSQYNNTVRDLVGDYSRPADRFPPEDFVNGFKNQLRTQGMPPLLAEAYSDAAEKLALNAFRAGDVNGLVPCKPAAARDAKCRDEFVRSFGQRAFRRPLTDDEMRRYTALFATQAANNRTFLDGARVVIEAMLQSPKFLFHVEAGADRRYADYEVASRLSYLLWDTMPDQRLFEAAAKGELRTAEGLARAARDMLAQPAARQAVDEFFAEWLRFDRVLGSVKDRRRYPEFTPELAAMMVQETRMLLGSLVWNDGNFMEAFTAGYSFLNADLARLYGVDPPTGEFELVRFPASSRRAGILGQASLLTANAGPVETSPTARGIFVREHLLCQQVPNPPPGVNTEIPEPSPDRPMIKRQRMQMHVESPACATCHKLMDPIGFGLENYDAIGRWRDGELIEFSGSGTKAVQLPIDSTGEIAGVTNSAFSEPRHIGRLLAENRGCQECVVKQLFRYSFGRVETAADRDTIREAYTKFRDSGFRFKELLLSLVRSPQFVEGLRP